MNGGFTYVNVGNVPKRKRACMAVNEVPQVARVDLQLLERRAVEEAEGLEHCFGQHFVVS